MADSSPSRGPAECPDRLHGRAAATLLEVLIALACICVLAALLLPLIGWMRQRAAQVACSSNLAQLGAVVRIYAELEGGRIPASQNWGATRPERSSAWFNQLPRLLSERAVARPGTIFQCPAFAGKAPGLLRNEVAKSYKMNVELDRVRAGTRGYRYRVFVLDRISDGQAVAMFCDAITTGGKGQWGYGGPNEVDDSRHRGWVSVLFCDGHSVRTPAIVEVRTGTGAVRWTSADWE